MKVALKFVGALILILVLIRTVEGVLTVRRETTRLNADIERDNDLLGHLLARAVEDVWKAEGRQAALELIDSVNIDSHPVQISWVPFTGEDGIGKQYGGEIRQRVMSGEAVGLRERDANAGEIQYFLIAPKVPEAAGAVRLSEKLAERSRYRDRALIRETVGGAVVILLGAGAFAVLGYLILGRPLNRLRRQVERIGEGDLTARLNMGGRDELSALGRGLDDMCAKLRAAQERERAEVQKRLEAMEQVRHMDRLTTIGRLAAGVAHELGTPLNVITGRAGMIAKGGMPPERAARNAETIHAQGVRMEAIVRNLLDFARQREPKRVRVSALDVARQALELVANLGHDAEIALAAKGEAGSLVAEMDPAQIQQVLTNLLENATHATCKGGSVRVEAESVSVARPAPEGASPGRYLRLCVSDTGEGIAQEHLSEIFDPFFTTKDIGQGTGLGLSIAYGIVREHGGWIDVESEVGKGSRFSVFIPQERTT